MLKSAFIATAFALLAGSPAAGAPAQEEWFQNPVLYEDFPDNDISTGPDGAFYFSASNFHYSPGAPILRSYDLVNWEFVGHSIPRLDFGEGYDLPPSGERAYRAGTWASTLRYRNSTGLWYWIGCTNFWNTWIYTAEAPEGPWSQAARLEGGVCYYDLGLLVDDDEAETMYVVYTHDGGRQINVTQLSPDGLRPVRTEGVLWPEQVGAQSVEGNRLYKIDGRYYVLNDEPGSTAFVWQSDSPWGPYEGRALAANVPGPLPGGGPPHQGSLVQTPGGDWYFMSFTWAFPAGRLPVLAPIRWGADGFPTLVTDASGAWGASYPYPLPPRPLAGWTGTDRFDDDDDDDDAARLSPAWEWNHNPDPARYRLGNSSLTLATASVTDDLYSARNTLTRRIHGPHPVGTVRLDVRDMAPGDRAGLAAFRDRSAYIGVHRDGGGDGSSHRLVAVFNMTIDEWSGETLDLGREVATAEVPREVLERGEIWLRVAMDARPDGTREARFSYSFDGAEFAELGGAYELYTGWPFFLGYRYGLFNFATRELGGAVRVLEFTSA